MPAKKSEGERKDRVVQTRVNQELDDALKAEAARRRLPVSQLVRNVLEDALSLMGNVVDNVDAIAQDAIGLGRQASADAQHLARRAAGSVRPPTPKATAAVDDAPTTASVGLDDDRDAAPSFDDIYAWQALTMNRDQRCAAGGEALARGDAAFLGLSDEPGPRRFICERCHTRIVG